jgi:hypothetical protein
MALSDLERRELHCTLTALSDGRLGEEDRRRLCDMLADPEVQELYVSHAMLDACLDLLGAELTATSDPEPPLAVELPDPPRPSFPFSLLYVSGDTPVASALLWLVMLFGAGLVVMVIAMLVVSVRGIHVTVDGGEVAQAPAVNAAPPVVPEAPRPEMVARLLHVLDCQWAGAQKAPSLGGDLAVGQHLELKAGLAQIVFQGGAKVLLQGPANLEVGSRTSALLHHGALTATVENPLAKGFEIRTPGMKYTDLGTEFGVLVARDGPQEMHVFRGKVQAEASGQGPGASGQWPVADGQNTGNTQRVPGAAPATRHAPPAPLVLAADEALRIAGPSKPPERIVADDRRFVRMGKFAQIVAEQTPEFRRWKSFRDEFCKRPDLVAYYDFQADDADRAVLRNRAASGRQYDGKLSAGAEWCEGRFPGKQALHFLQPGSAVDLDISESCQQMTIVAWIKVEQPADNDYQGILLSDTWEQPGALHWQLSGNVKRGTGFGISPTGGIYDPERPYAPEFLGCWAMFALTYDAARGSTLYFNGAATKSASAAGPPILFGKATMGGCSGSGRRLLGRIDELAIFRAALGEAQMRALFEAGQLSK